MTELHPLTIWCHGEPISVASDVSEEVIIVTAVVIVLENDTSIFLRLYFIARIPRPPSFPGSEIFTVQQ